MRLVCISDTHTFHEDVNLPDGDILIHAGDFTNKGGKSDVEDFFGWLMRIKPKYRYILFIAGNHDKCFDEKYSEMNDWLMSDWLAEAIAELEKNDIIYLKDSSIELEGVKFYGMPWTPWFFGEYWAFNKKIGPEMQEKIDMIEPCDVLITHGPPLYTGDLVAREGIHVGCPLLKEKIDEIINDAELKERDSNQILEFTKEVKNKNTEEKKIVIEALWKIIYSDEDADMYETNLMKIGRAHV